VSLFRTLIAELAEKAACRPIKVTRPAREGPDGDRARMDLLGSVPARHPDRKR
jgi:hypothetical protein